MHGAIATGIPEGVTEAMISGGGTDQLIECMQCWAIIERRYALYPDALTEGPFCGRECFEAWIADHADKVADYLLS